MGWPNVFSAAFAKARMGRSEDAPGALPMTNLIGFVGNRGSWQRTSPAPRHPNKKIPIEIKVVFLNVRVMEHLLRLVDIRPKCQNLSFFSSFNEKWIFDPDFNGQLNGHTLST
jgi:hypothetical protein